VGGPRPPGDRQGLPPQHLGLRILAHRLVRQGQLVQQGRQVGVIGPLVRLPDGQRLPEQCQGMGSLALPPGELRRAGQRLDQVRVPRTDQPPKVRQGVGRQFLRLRELAERRVLRGDVQQSPGKRGIRCFQGPREQLAGSFQHDGPLGRSPPLEVLRGVPIEVDNLLVCTGHRLALPVRAEV
jgi:hypothetical protein